MTLTPADDHFAIELEGALAGMLALAQTGKGPGGAAVSEVFRSSVKVVAGARNQRFLRLAERRIPKLAA